MIETKQIRDTVCDRLRREGRQVSRNLNEAFASVRSMERLVRDNQVAIGNAEAQIANLRRDLRRACRTNPIELEDINRPGRDGRSLPRTPRPRPRGPSRAGIALTILDVIVDTSDPVNCIAATNRINGQIRDLERDIARRETAIARRESELQTQRRNIEQGQAVLQQIADQRRLHGCP